jgi:processive 1,2-diacylglycerol beta-glucosyltransferase
VLAGKNTEMLKRLEALAQKYPARLCPQGFTNEVEKFTVVSNLIITKVFGNCAALCQHICKINF